MLGSVWRRWNWLDDGLIPLAGIAMTAAWCYPLFVTFLRSPQTGVLAPGFSVWLCMGITLAGFLVGRLASQNRMASVIVVVGGMVAILVALLLIVPSSGYDIEEWFIGLFRFGERGRLTGELIPVPLVIIVLVSVLWMRGLRLAGLQREAAVGSFVVGTVALGGLLLMSELLPPDVGSDVQTRTDLVDTFARGMAPLFLLSIPMAVVFLLLASIFGDWASTAGEISLVVGVLFLNMIMPFGPSSSRLVGWLLLFLASGLALLALMSVSSTLREQERLIGVRLKPDRYWVIIMLAVVGAVLLLGLVLGQVFVPSILLGVLSLLRPIWWLVRTALLYIILVFAYLFFALLEPLMASLEGRPARPLGTLVSPVEPVPMEELAQETSAMPVWFGTMLQVILVLGAVMTVALLFYMAIRRRDKRTVALSDDVIETRETILSVDLIQEQIRGLLDSLGRRRKQPYFADLGPPGDPRRKVREMYQKLLAYAIRHNAPRQRQQTPDSYRPTLAQLWDGQETAVETLTRLYHRVRYGDKLPDEDELAAVQAAFTGIESTLEEDTETAMPAPGEESQ